MLEDETVCLRWFYSQTDVDVVSDCCDLGLRIDLVFQVDRRTCTPVKTRARYPTHTLNPLDICGFLLIIENILKVSFYRMI